MLINQYASTQRNLTANFNYSQGCDKILGLLIDLYLLGVSVRQPEVKMTQETKVHGNSTYREVYNSIAFNLCKLGANDEELSEAFNVDVRTIHNWKVAYTDFFHSIKDGKTFYDTGLIENALKKKALGYEYEEVKEEMEEGKPSKTTVTKKHLAPDTGAIALYLKNRAPKDWKDKIEHTHIEKRPLSEVLKDAANEK